MYESPRGVTEHRFYEAVSRALLQQGCPVSVHRCRDGVLRIVSMNPMKIAYLALEADHKLVLTTDGDPPPLLFMEEISKVLGGSSQLQRLLIGAPETIIWLPIYRDVIILKAVPATDAIDTAADTPGVYAIVQREEIIYIGMSGESLAKRLAHYRPVMPNDWRIAQFDAPPGVSVGTIERLLIEVHQPRFNDHGLDALMAQAKEERDGNIGKG